MTIFHSLFFLAREVFNAAVVSRADGFFRGLSDGAEVLAEEVSEPCCEWCAKNGEGTCHLDLTCEPPSTLPLWPESEAPLILPPELDGLITALVSLRDGDGDPLLQWLHDTDQEAAELLDFIGFRSGAVTGLQTPGDIHKQALNRARDAEREAAEECAEPQEDCGPVERWSLTRDELDNAARACNFQANRRELTPIGSSSWAQLADKFTGMNCSVLAINAERPDAPTPEAEVDRHPNGWCPAVGKVGQLSAFPDLRMRCSLALGHSGRHMTFHGVPLDEDQK